VSVLLLVEIVHLGFFKSKVCTEIRTLKYICWEKYRKFQYFKNIEYFKKYRKLQYSKIPISIEISISMTFGDRQPSELDKILLKH